MSVTLGGVTLPLACVEYDGRASAIKDIEFPGVDGKGGMDMGLRGKPIRITGRLTDISASPTAATIDGLDTSTLGTLSHNGRTTANCRVVNARTHDYRGDGATGKTTCLYTIDLESLSDG